jgi:hypothetical protein
MSISAGSLDQSAAGGGSMGTGAGAAAAAAAAALVGEAPLVELRWRLNYTTRTAVRTSGSEEE